MPRHPLFGIGILFASGICLGRFIEPPFYLLYSLGLLAIATGFVFLSKQKQSAIFIYAFYFLLGGIFYVNAAFLPANHILKLNLAKNQPVYLKGIIASSPAKKGTGRISRTSFILTLKEISLSNNWYKTSGKVLVNCYSSGDFSYADYIALEGSLFKPPNFRLSSRLSYREYLLSKGINFIFSVRKNNFIQIISRNQANLLNLISLRSKQKIRDIINKNLPSLEAGILEAVIVGERGSLSKEVNNLFVQTGTVHILAISGFNVGIVIFIILILLKALRINRNIRFSLTIIFIIIYAIITGSQPSVIRASIMAVVILIGILLQRESDIYNSVSFAALIILMLNPRAIFDVGFQLSFLSVISIVWMTEKIEKPILKAFNSKSRVFAWFVRSLSVSLAAWLGVLGLVAYYFNIFSPVTVLANLFVVPLSSLIVALGFCLIFFGSIFPGVAFIFASSAKLCLDVLVYGVWIFHKLPGAFVYLGTLRIPEVLLYYLSAYLIFRLIKAPSANSG